MQDALRSDSCPSGSKCILHLVCERAGGLQSQTLRRPLALALSGPKTCRINSLYLQMAQDGPECMAPLQCSRKAHSTHRFVADSAFLMVEIHKTWVNMAQQALSIKS